MKKIDYKVPGGKLLRIELQKESGIIKDIKINGDFFLYPEESILLIEKFLLGKKEDKIGEQLYNFLLANNIEIIGFTAYDIEKVIKES